MIGDRAFHRDARVATLLAKSLMHGLLLRRHGATAASTSRPRLREGRQPHEVPVDRRSLKAILADDAKPYEWLSTSLASVMPAHVVYPKVDAHPAGFAALAEGDPARQPGFTGAPSSATTSAWKARGASAARSATRGGAGARWTPAATWCCCATSRSTAVRRWMSC